VKFVAFDIETAREAPEDKDDSYDLGVTCVGTCIVEGTDRIARTWHGGKWFGRYEERMPEDKVTEFVGWLLAMTDRGYDIVSWNGLGFDFRVMAESAPGIRGMAVDLALDSIDPFYAMLCEKGFGIGLATAAEGMMVEGKADGMDGLDAIEMWQGPPSDQRRVLEYVKQDAETTANVYEAVVAAGHLRWTSRSGRTNYWRPVLKVVGDRPFRMLTVEEASALPEPDTSWMTDPWPRSDFYGWTGWEPGEEGG
jgi:hypothetical protein